MGSWYRLRILGTALGAALLLAACNRGDPHTAKFWVDKAAQGRSERERLADLEKLRVLLKTTHEPGAAAQVAGLLKNQPGDAMAAAAEILGELGDKSAVPQLVDAIDLSLGSGTDNATEQANHANKAIAEALGQLGDPAGVPGLLRLIKAKNNYVLISAINALGDIKADAAVGPLSTMATDETIEPFISKKAIMALGNIGDPKALPAIHKMLFKERRGISFFPESSFAFYQIRKGASDLLLIDLKRTDQDFFKWADANHILEGAILAKSAQILGDLAEPRAEGTLVSLLSYKDEDAVMQYAVRIQAADALGRLRVKAATRPLESMLGDEEANARATYCRALTFIGDRGAVPALLKGAATGSISARQFAYKAAAMLGDARDLKAYDALVKQEDKREKAECRDQGIGDADCADQIKKNVDLLGQYRAGLAAPCASGATSCWQGLLQDKSVYVRQRAALELGRSGKAEAVAALFEVVQRPFDGATIDEITEQDNARYNAILALHWLLDDGIKPAHAGEMAQKLDAQVEVERRKTATQRSAEDVKRLAVRLRRVGA